MVVTGAAGQLGSRWSTALADAGASVVRLDVRRTADDGAGRFMDLQADVCDREALEEALRSVEAELGPPHGLVNAAALDTPPGHERGMTSPESVSAEEFEATTSVNVTGTYLACQVFGGRMAQLGRGAVVNVASVYGLVSPDQRIYPADRHTGARFVKPAAYTASKAAVIGLTKWLATWWAPSGVRVNCLTLGGVLRDQAPEFVRRYSEKVPMGRMAEEGEYDGAVIFLLSDASSYMTGSNVVVDGGLTAW